VNGFSFNKCVFRWLFASCFLIFLSSCAAPAQSTVSSTLSITPSSEAPIFPSPTVLPPSPSPMLEEVSFHDINVDTWITLPSGQYLLYRIVEDNEAVDSISTYYVYNPSESKSYKVIENVTSASISPNGESLAVIAQNEIGIFSMGERQGSSQRIFIRLELPDDQRFWSGPNWSSDSSRFLVRFSSGIWDDSLVFMVIGDQLIELPNLNQCGYFSWSNNGEYFAADCYSPSSEILLFSKEGEYLSTLPGCLEDQLICTRPSLSKVGNFLLFFRSTGLVGGPLPDFERVYLANLDCVNIASCIRPATEQSLHTREYAWSHIESRYAILNELNSSIEIDDAVSGTSTPLMGASSLYSGLRWSIDGHWISYLLGEHSLYVRNYPDGSSIKVATGDPLFVSDWFERHD